MTAAEADLRDRTELERVEAWRLEELRRAGYDRAAAEKIAPRHDVDLHIAVELMKRGCSQELALEILL